MANVLEEVPDLEPQLGHGEAHALGRGRDYDIHSTGVYYGEDRPRLNG